MTNNMAFGVVPGAIPLLGHTLRALRGPMEFLRGLHRYGDLVELRVGPRRVLAVCHPDLFHQVLADGRTFDKGGQIFDKARQVVGNGLVTCPHAVHRRQRRLVQPAFGRDRLPRYAEVMTEEIGTALSSWRAGQVLDVPVEMHRIGARVTARTMFSTDLDEAAVTEIIRSTALIEQGMYTRMVLPSFAERLPTPGNRRYTRARARLDAIVRDVIAGHRRDRADHGDLMSMLLTAQHDGLSDEEVSDQVMTLLLSGIETTATALAWTLHLLGDRPDLVDRLRAEADLDGRAAGWADLPRLQLANRVITETLRLYPPVWLFTRLTTRDTELAGHPVPAGTILLLSPVMVHYRTEVFDRPTRFDPDRWLPAATAVPRGALVPFGGGARKCIGEHFGLTEAALVLASIVSRWRFLPLDGARVRVARRVVLSPHALRMRLEPRH